MSEKTVAVIKEVCEWIICFVIAYVLYITINYLFGAISGVRQSSMYPTAVEGEKLLIQRPTIFKKELKTGDIITFESPINTFGKNSDNIAEFNEYTGFKSFTYHVLGFSKMTYIKRVIGLPGDKIEILEDGRVKINDVELKEEYVKKYANTPGTIYTSLVVPENTVYVMGDNRPDSKDSREFGCVPIDKITGYVICRVWPFNRLGNLE